MKNVVRIAPERLTVRRIKADIAEERDVLPGLVLPEVVMEHGTAMAAAATTMAEVVSKAAVHHPPV